VSRREGARTILAAAAAGSRRCSKCGLRLRSDNRDPARRCGYCQAGVDREEHIARQVGRERALEDLAEGPLLETGPRGGYGVRKSRTFSMKQLKRIVPVERERPGMAAALLRAELARPKTRGQCEGGERPCPFVACKFHLFLDVTPAGGVQVNHPGLELEQLRETCALDVADRGGVTLEEVGELLGITRERVRQMEGAGLTALRSLTEGM
jgi:hypothetical protein